MTSKALAMGIGGVLVMGILVGGVLLLRRWAASRDAGRGRDDVARPAPMDVAASTPRPDPGDRTADEADFASEHSRSTFAFDQPGGPEGRPEAESPRGLAGMDDPRTVADRLRRRKGLRDQP